MTKKDKNLLLKDLCARLSYRVFIHYHWSREGKTIDEDRELDFSDVETLKYNIENHQNNWCEISWKPYLRPMSSMTEEEAMKYITLTHYNTDDNGKPYRELTIDAIDWLNANHFDYRGLIPMGLALEAPEGMYETE